MNVGKSKVIRCSRYGNAWGSNVCDTKRRTVREMDCFQSIGSQVAADGGCEMNVVYTK